jgi:pimeloyl-ACP methyl ester carboxylesterase
MKSITYQDKKIAYQSEGKGISVLFVHGFCEDSTVWDDLKKEMIPAGYNVVALDLPGFGESEVVENASIEIMADIVNELFIQLNISKAIFIGHSMGGYVGLTLAKKHENKLLGLGLFHSHPYADSEEKKAGRRRSIEIVQTKGNALYVQQLIPSLFAPKFVKSNSFLVDKLVHRASAYPSEGITNALQAMMDRPDQSEVLKTLQRPVLFIIGKEDTAIPAEASMNQTILPDTSSILLLEEVAHMGMFEARKKTQQAVLQFLEFCTKTKSA